MKVFDLEQPRAIDLAVDAVHTRPLIVQLPSVFVLLAAPTSAGARQLDHVKTRLPGKNYGTAIGSLTRFVEQAQRQEMPPEFSAVDQFVPLTGTFVRLPFRSVECNTATIRAGTHQGVLLDGLQRQLFRRIEESFLDQPADPIWQGRNYCAPLCTSCNESGHPERAIFEAQKAFAFAETFGVDFVLRSRAADGKLGSYPIFGFEREGVRVHREGPRLDQFKERIPQRLRSW